VRGLAEPRWALLAETSKIQRPILKEVAMKKKIVAVLMVLVLLMSSAMLISAQVSSSNTNNGIITGDGPPVNLDPPVDTPWEFPS